jgi:DNA (cytosine-5)-methyltransferase 1
MQKDMTKIRFIDLFAGIGGIRLAFKSKFTECVYSSEWDKFAQQTYSANFREIPDGDITLVKPRDIPQFDLLLAGFPCQPFSNAGLKLGFEDTRGTLFFDVARIVKHHRPAMVLLENVKGFAKHDKGNTMRVVTATLEQLGYNVSSQILNAKHFGLPQNRERIYIVALKRSLFGPTPFTFPKGSHRPTKLGNILEKRVHARYTLSDALWAGHVRRKAEHERRGNGFGYSLFTADSTYTSTISARYYKDGSEILIGQGHKNPRKLTPREAARLQGFPDRFKIPVSDVQAYKQFGNSVAVPVVRAIARRMIKLMRNPSAPPVHPVQTNLALDA